MEADKLTTREVAQVAHAEGLAHAIRTFLPAERIDDPELAGLWEETRDRLEQIEALLQPHYG